VRPANGGVHPGRGTRNALLGLGQGRYLEVIAPDPAQKEVPKVRAELPAMLKQLAIPRLVGWAVRTLNIEASAERLRKYGVAFQGPTPGSRARPDGRVLHWKTLNFDDDRDGVLPFLIEWGADSGHPSADAPAGCNLEGFAVVSTDSSALSAEFQDSASTLWSRAARRHTCTQRSLARRGRWSWASDAKPRIVTVPSPKSSLDSWV